VSFWYITSGLSNTTPVTITVRFNDQIWATVTLSYDTQYFEISTTTGIPFMINEANAVLAIDVTVGNTEGVDTQIIFDDFVVSPTCVGLA
jgi:hypothetical protein